MTFKTAKNMGFGLPLIGTSYTTAQGVDVGARCKCNDDAGLGEAEFIWLPATVALTKGNVVTYKHTLAGVAGGVTAKVATTAIKGRPLAVAMMDMGAGEFGWFQIHGLALLFATAGSGADVALYADGTAGKVTTTQANGVQLVNMVAETALNTPIAGYIYAAIAYPFVQSQVV